MRSIPQALMWELFRHGRWSIPGFYVLGNLFPMLLFALFSHLGVEPQDHAFLVLHVCFMPIMMACFAGGILPAQGALSRLYTTPISTASLVAWHMYPGGLLLGIEVAISAWMYNLFFHMTWPILGPALFAAAAWASVQILVSTSQKTLSSVFLTGTPCLVLIGWLTSRYGRWFSHPTHYWTEVTPVEAATLLGVVFVAYMLTVVAVARDRCGEPMPSLGGWKWIKRKLDAVTTSSGIGLQPFASAAHAQFWYDWTWKGLALPLVVVLSYLIGCVAWLVNIVAGHGTETPFEDFYRGIASSGGMLSFVAGIAGILSTVSDDGTSARKQGESLRSLFGSDSMRGMGHFLSTRPFTNADFAKSILQGITRSVLIAWGLWFAGLAICLLIALLTHQKLAEVFPPEAVVWYLPLTLLGTWIAMTSSATIGLTGRGARLIIVGSTALVSNCIGLILIKEFISREAHDHFLEICAFGGSISIVLFALYSFTKAHRSGFLSRKSQCTAASVAVGIAILAIASRPHDLPMTGYAMILAFSALVVLPIATTPLAISWNRHR